jgi:hypothetical protein
MALWLSQLVGRQRNHRRLEKFLAILCLYSINFDVFLAFTLYSYNFESS